MAVRVPHAMSSGLSASMAEVAAMSESAFLEDSEEDDDEEDEEIEESMDSDSGLTADIEGLSMDDEGYGLDDESHGIEDEGHSVESDGLGLEEEEEAVLGGSLAGSSGCRDDSTPAAVETEGFLTELGAQVQMQGGLISDHAVRLEELSPALFESLEDRVVRRVACEHLERLLEARSENLGKVRLQTVEERRARLELSEVIDEWLEVFSAFRKFSRVVFATVNWKGKQILIANVHVILVLDSDVMKVLFSATVMAISVISISSDSSEDSVGTPARRWIPTETPIIAPTIPLSPDYTPASPDTHIASDSESPIIPRRRVMILSPGQPIHLQFDRYATIANGPIQLLMRGVVWTVSCFRKLAVGHLCLIILHQIYFSSDDPARDSSSDSSFEASSDFHSDASSDSSSGHSLSDHSSPDLPSTSAGPSRKRRRSPTMSVPALSPVFGALSPVVEISLRDDVIVRVSDKPHLEQDIDPEIQAEIDECFAYADALRDRGIDARVVVEAVDRDETETGVRGPVEVRVERVTHPAMPKDIPEPAQEGAVEVTYGTLGDFVQRIVRVESAVTALTERVAELERDNMMLRGTGRQTCACARSYQWIPSLEDSLKMPNTRSGASMTHEEVEELVNDEVALKQMEEIEMEEMEEMEMEETEKTEMDTGMETMA
ncbi:hypothetical protein Tco_0471375 [Tanacetum coccineum]